MVSVLLPAHKGRVKRQHAKNHFCAGWFPAVVLIHGSLALYDASSAAEGAQGGLLGRHIAVSADEQWVSFTTCPWGKAFVVWRMRADA